MAATDQKKLRWGFTTGTAAAAAAKGALIYLLSGEAPGRVTVRLLTGDDIVIAVHSCRRLDERTAVCIVIKDAGDDPDVTHNAEIGARVKWTADEERSDVEITGGQGVGRVTKPGLEVPPGLPAINPGPVKMIRQSVAAVQRQYKKQGRVMVEIFVPRGVELARHTLNGRLGIVDGISILGTTGVVKPMSHDAYIATVRAGVSVAKASGLQCVVFTTGRRSERFAQALWPELPAEAFVQIGDYFEKSMAMAAGSGVGQVRLAVFFGKAVKMAQKISHTHARSARMTLTQLSRWTMEIAGDKALAQQVGKANTARQAFDLLKGKQQMAVIERVGSEMVQTAELVGKGNSRVRGIIFGFDGTVVFDSGEVKYKP